MSRRFPGQAALEEAEYSIEQMRIGLFMLSATLSDMPPGAAGKLPENFHFDYDRASFLIHALEKIRDAAEEGIRATWSEAGIDAGERP